jgi:hypothetical protein
MTKFTKANGEPYLSGTEWEYEDAANADPPPDILLYRRTQKPLIEIDDPDFETKKKHYDLVNGFLSRFRNPDGSFAGSVTDYAAPDALVERLVSDLTNLLRRRIGVAGMAGAIFISYRHGADSGFAGRLYDRLEHSFGRERVFIDVCNIAPGEDFVTFLQARVAACDVLLALIGRGWLAATDAAGRRRLDNPDDFVRIEIAAALAQGKRVIPVLSDNTAMPRAEELPEDIKPLARRNAIRFTRDRFKDDAERLIRVLEKALSDTRRTGIDF